jgi:hypothetical protein
MTADNPTHAGSDNSVSTDTEVGTETEMESALASDPDAQHIINHLQRCGGRASRQRLLLDGHLPEDVLDIYLTALDDAGVVSRRDGYSGILVELTAGDDA